MASFLPDVVISIRTLPLTCLITRSSFLNSAHLIADYVTLVNWFYVAKGTASRSPKACETDQGLSVLHVRHFGELLEGMFVFVCVCVCLVVSFKTGSHFIAHPLPTLLFVPKSVLVTWLLLERSCFTWLRSHCPWHHRTHSAPCALPQVPGIWVRGTSIDSLKAAKSLLMALNSHCTKTAR